MVGRGRIEPPTFRFSGELKPPESALWEGHAVCGGPCASVVVRGCCYTRCYKIEIVWDGCGVSSQVAAISTKVLVTNGSGMGSPSRWNSVAERISLAAIVVGSAWTHQVPIKYSREVFVQVSGLRIVTLSKIVIYSSNTGRRVVRVGRGPPGDVLHQLFCCGWVTCYHRSIINGLLDQS